MTDIDIQAINELRESVGELKEATQALSNMIKSLSGTKKAPVKKKGIKAEAKEVSKQIRFKMNLKSLAKKK